MFTKKCNACGKSFHLRDVKVDEHWNSWSFEPAYCYCPHCDSRLQNINPSSVEFVNTLTPKNAIILFLFFFFSLFAVGTDTINITAPLMLMVLGLYLAKYSKSKDNRIAGVVLFVIFTAILIITNYYA